MSKLKYIQLALFSFFSISSLWAFDVFWEAPQPFSPRQGSFPVSAYSDNLSVVAWQEVTPNRDTRIAATGFININVAVKERGKEWEQKRIAAGPYSYSGTEPSILSLVIDNSGKIVIAAARTSSQTDILISEDKGSSFSSHTVQMGVESSVAPRIFVRADGGYILFITRGLSQSLAIYYSRSNDGITWSSFELFTPENSLALNFLPVHASIGRRDIVFFQSFVTSIETYSSFQLFFKTSDDGGRTWTEGRRFTNFNDPVMQQQASPDYFDNQRPHLTRYGNNLLLVWERRYSSQQPQIYSAVINNNAGIVGSVQRVNTEEAYCNNPIGFIYENTPAVVWFDNIRGINRTNIAVRGNSGWETKQLSGNNQESSFARPVIDAGGMYVFWQNTTRSSEQIYVLAPDRTAASPRITAVNFNPSIPGQAERVRFAWNIPEDTSGIAGFSWIWSHGERAEPQRRIMIPNTGNVQNMNMELNAVTDGEWSFGISAQDNAGNWSEPARISYYRKTTPPPEVTINEPQLDSNGFIVSNNFNLSWQPSTDPFIAGYTWSLQYLGTTDQTVNAPPSSIMGGGHSASYANQDNGIWGFSVSAIDMAGNISQPSSIVFRANKFVPYTSVSYIDAHQDEQGVLSVRIIGRGFATNGEITSVVLSQDGREDVESNFNILSDREIDGITFENLGEGEYIIKLNHSSRGWYTPTAASSSISVGRSGTVKYGDYSMEWRPSWTILSDGKITVNPVFLLAALLIVFCLFGSVAAVRGIGGVIAEGAAVQQEALAIITGDFMPSEKKQRFVRIQKRGRGLRFKLASFTIGLVLLIVIMISTPMYLIMTSMQRETLLQSLWDRSKVLLEGLATSARAYLPMGDSGLLELGFLPAQSTALPEADYVTITGFRSGSIHSDYVWATNDPEILSKIDTAEYRPGFSRITDDITPRYEQISSELNNRAREAVGDLSTSIMQLTQEGISLALSTDAASMRRLEDIQVTINSLQVRLTEILTEISGEIGSQPDFSAENIHRNGERAFIFFKPVMYRQGAEDNYFRGLIRLEVSLDSIMNEIFQGQFILLRVIIIVALAAILIGIAGAFIFSALIIRPIRKLVSHIEIIRDTEDKSKLAGVDINIKSKDEIAILGNTINDMTQGLVKAALAASDLSIGKEIQKKFIPLEVDSQGNKKTSGFKHTPHLNFFGYYEGAKGVSGDYFDYLELDGRYYAIIKCDVAGKGIPAALIMIQVATMFINFFRRWKPSEKGMHIEDLVYQINDFLETLGFKGRFAAFSLCILDSKTGEVRFCNAGDNIVHLYDESEGRLKTITLPQTPATGVLPNFMIQSTGGYKVQTLKIDHGDILLLYTDGIEEAKRKFRSNDFKEITCTAGPVDTPHENHICGQADEEMSPERVEGIINAVMAREIYTLKKFHNPEGDMKLEFDFSSSEGSVEDVIMAMVSVEKIFRCYKNPKAGEDSRILVDKKIDEFLKKYFLQYRHYCSHTREYLENEAYLYYTFVEEDEQYDDLTILGIKRK
ncbi:MAG: SpoIIE family protein phosphatase [Treponema sp.]|jgi:serine phosphatase RsbU (regulator of sigma subunit)|nr:SpoIIE family protein phosphatase [Treponema sp.]